MKKIIAALLGVSLTLGLNSCENTQLENNKGKLTPIVKAERPVPAEVDLTLATDEILGKYIGDMDRLKDEIKSHKSEVVPSGTVWYVSEKGQNSNDGKSEKTPLATPDMVKPKSGDTVLFERGSEFRMGFKLVGGVSYSTYGEGEKPIFIGSWAANDAALWKETDAENVYEFAYDVPEGLDVGQIVFDDGKAWGIKVMKLNNEDKRVDQGECFNGIESFNNGTDAFAGYADLKSDLEFYCDRKEAKCYLYSAKGNPAERFESIEVVKKGNLVSGEAKKVTIEDLVFKYCGSHGIGVGNATDFTVRYCEFYYIGGSIQGYGIFDRAHPTRFGNAVENWMNCENFTIDHCYASQIYDCCFTTQWQGDSKGADVVMKNVKFTNNISEYSNTGLEVWMSDNVGYPDAEFKFEDFDCYGNYTYRNGFGWSHQRPKKNANFFYGGTNHNSTQHYNSVFHDNVNLFATSTGLLAHFTNGEPGGHTFRDNVWFMEYGKLLAKSSVLKDGLPTSGNFDYLYTWDGIADAQANGIEKGTKFYATLPEGMDSLPEREIPRETFEEYMTYEPVYEYTVPSGAVYPVQVIKPTAIDENREYPLIVYLHNEFQAGKEGVTDEGLSIKQFRDSLPEAAYNAEKDCVILVMRSYDKNWGLGEPGTEMTLSGEPAVLSDLDSLVDLVADGGAGVKIDKTKLSLAGNCSGANGVLELLSAHPDKYFRALAVSNDIVGGVKTGTTELKIYHGKLDDKVTSEKAGAYADEIGAEFTDFEREDRMIAHRMKNELDWLIGD